MSAQIQPVVLCERNLERARQAVRVELLEALQYERNYSPLTWFKSVPISPREIEPTVRNLRAAKVRRLGLTFRKNNLADCRALEAEIRELDKQMVEGKQ